MRTTTKCEHYDCRCARAAELAEMADRTGDASLLAQATEVHSQEVECRRAKDEGESIDPSDMADAGNPFWQRFFNQ